MSDEKPIILVVDDTPENIDIIGGILRDAYKVKAALNGEKALKIASSDKPPKLILLDVMMPDMDGYEVCRRLKENEQTQGIPVIFVSGNTGQDEIQKGLDLGAADYLIKPIDPNLLNEKIKPFL